MAAADFGAVHDRLRDIVIRHRGDLALTNDEPGGVTIEVPGLEGKPWGHVAGTRVGKSYVSFHLMPVYSSPELMSSMSPELRKRMQGKTCFNFRTVDEPLLAELDTLTGRAIPGFRAVAEGVAATRRRRSTSAVGSIRDVPAAPATPLAVVPANSRPG